MPEPRGYHGHLADARRQLRDGGDATELIAAARVERDTYEDVARHWSEKAKRLEVILYPPTGPELDEAEAGRST